MAGKWEDRRFWEIYELGREGKTDAQIAKTLGITSQTFSNWCRKYSLLQQALSYARTVQKERSLDTALPPDLHTLYERLTHYEDQNAPEKIDALLRDKGDSIRQRLFLHALPECDYDPSKALKRVGCSKRDLEAWTAHDPDFNELLEQTSWHKGNLFESSLISLVKRGDASAIIFANKTYNRQRGYGEVLKTETTSTHTHAHLHASLSLDDLDLPLEVRKIILAAIRKKKELLAQSPPEDTMIPARLSKEQEASIEEDWRRLEEGVEKHAEAAAQPPPVLSDMSPERMAELKRLYEEREKIK